MRRDGLSVLKACSYNFYLKWAFMVFLAAMLVALNANDTAWCSEIGSLTSLDA